jgi:peptidoglycan hydrolase-like protein with peptidoglycan-binding domain
MKDSLVDNKLTLKESTTTLGGVFKTDLENSPSNHSKRALGNWQSDNAWDVFASPGTVVNSYTEGTVSKIRDTGKNSGKIFGTQVSIKGNDDFPDIFYTHLKNVKLKNGDVVKVGDYIGEISEWIGHEGMTHVHIGLPRGNHLKDLLVNSDKIFTGSKDSTITPHSDYTFLSSLENISSSGKEFKNLKSPGKSIPYDSDVEKIQTALQILGYSLPKWGVDGLFGPETESAVLKFESDNGITPDGKLTDDDIEKILELLETKGFEESDLGRIQKTSDFDKINIGGDKDFYESVLKGIGAPITDENMKFLYAWRKGEGGKATNNPFNTTFNLKKDSGISNYNTVGVKNYSNPNYGVEATVKTLLLPYYTCITDGLKKDIGSDKISRCESLKTWGTGDLVAKVLNSGNVTPPKIYNA